MTATAGQGFTTLTPSLSVSSTDAYSVVIGGTVNGTVNVSGTDLYSDITVTLNDPSKYFSIDKTSISKTDAQGAITVTFNPTTVGTYNATLTITSDYAETKTLKLVGKSTPAAPVAIAATDVLSSGFTANWSASDGADSYLLTVYDASNAAVEGYAAKNVGNVTSYAVDNLMPEAKYTYAVQATTEDGATSAESNKIEVTTQKGPVITYVAIGAFSQPVNTAASKTL